MNMSLCNDIRHLLGHFFGHCSFSVELSNLERVIVCIVILFKERDWTKYSEKGETLVPMM